MYKIHLNDIHIYIYCGPHSLTSFIVFNTLILVCNQSGPSQRSARKQVRRPLWLKAKAANGMG